MDAFSITNTYPSRNLGSLITGHFLTSEKKSQIADRCAKSRSRRRRRRRRRHADGKSVPFPNLSIPVPHDNLDNTVVALAGQLETGPSGTPRALRCQLETANTEYADAVTAGIGCEPIGVSAVALQRNTRGQCRFRCVAIAGERGFCGGHTVRKAVSRCLLSLFCVEPAIVDVIASLDASRCERERACAR
jgi:hypothetical protein